MARKLKIALGDAAEPGRVLNAAWTWDRLLDRIQTPLFDGVNREAFAKLPAAEQAALEQGAGFLSGGHYKGGAFRARTCMCRSLLTLLADELTPEQGDWLLSGRAWRGEYEYAAYSARCHTPERPRLWLLMPLAADVLPGEYEAVARIVAHKLDSSMRLIDPESFSLAHRVWLPTAGVGPVMQYEHPPTRPVH